MNTNYIIGDSITYGIGDFESSGWASMFKNYIVNKDDSKVCNNYVHVVGFPGATSSDILEKDDFIDGLHPNHKGHKKIFEYVIENIK